MTPQVSHPSGRPSASLHFVVGEMNGKLDQLIASLLPQLQSIRQDHSSLEARVVVLEQGRWKVVGIVSAVVFIATVWEPISAFIK